MAFCLTKQAKDAFKMGLKNGEIDPKKLSSMDSQARHEYLGKYVGKENAKQVNALFESKLLLKNQKAGYISWAKKVSGISKEAKRDLISRIERLDKVLNPSEEKQFLQDLASTRLGIDISAVEAKNISELSNKSAQLKESANADGVFSNNKDRLAYGMSRVALEKYVNDLKLQSKRISFTEQPIKKVASAVKQTPGALKSIVASLDNSLWGRQGIKTLLDVRTSHIWAKNFLKSFGDIGKEILGFDAMDAVKADIYSRPNALNGKYKAGGYGLDVLSEEAFPSALPEKIPALGRLFKASESAYNGGALRLRADLADRFIKIAEKQGINTLDPVQAKGIGTLVSSMTGRGGIGVLEPAGSKINTVMFSIKFLKSNFDTLTAHMFDSKATSFAKKEAAKNLLSMTASVAAALTIAKTLDPNSVDEDPRSTNFGKVKIFGHWTDITGGMGSLVTLASRLTPTYHNGVLGFWTRTSTGGYKNLTEGKYGQQTALDIFENFWEGKLSPVAGIARDVWQGKDYSGKPITPEGEAKKLLLPISAQNFLQLKEDPNSSNILGSMIIDGLGLSTSTYSNKADWSTSTSKNLEQFKEKVGAVKFQQANDQFNTIYNSWYEQIRQSDSFKSISDEEKSTLITNAKEKIKQEIFKSYKFKYKKERKTTQEKLRARKLKKLLP